MVHSQALPDILKIAALRRSCYSQRGRSEHSRVQVFEQRLFEDLGDINWSRLQNDVRLSGAAPAKLSAVLDPVDDVLISPLHNELKLGLHLLGAARKIANLGHFVGDQLKFRKYPLQGLHNGVVLVA